LRILDQDILPPIENWLRDMELPLDCSKESSFVEADLRNMKTRNLAPCTSRVVSVLEIFRSQDESC
jgi:hypothetical protein